MFVYCLSVPIQCTRSCTAPDCQYVLVTVFVLSAVCQSFLWGTTCLSLFVLVQRIVTCLSVLVLFAVYILSVLVLCTVYSLQLSVFVYCTVYCLRVMVLCTDIPCVYCLLSVFPCCTVCTVQCLSFLVECTVHILSVILCRLSVRPC